LPSISLLKSKFAILFYFFYGLFIL